jgi:hypothetical protein
LTFILKYASIVYEREERYEAYLLWFLVSQWDYSSVEGIQTSEGESPREASDRLGYGFGGDFPPRDDWIRTSTYDRQRDF